MPLIRLEWVPIATFSLGLFGFDHLQLVYQPGEAVLSGSQDEWLVIEGTRDVTENGVRAGVQGHDGRTTLARANAAYGEELVEKIGTPETRGSRPIPFAGDEFHAWQSMAAIGRDIEAQSFPYIAFGFPGAPVPAVNSASVVASLLHHAGIEIADHIPFGMHLSPGLSTLLGTSGDDTLKIGGGFTAIMAGQGNDTLSGGFEAGQTDRLFGGEGDDTFLWSSGFNVIHGGQPQLAYQHDGIDMIDYTGAGVVTLSANPRPVPHTTPQFTAQFADGRDHLFSIERIKWGTGSDRVIVNPGVDVIEDDVVLDMGSDAGGKGDVVDFIVSERALLITPSGFDELQVFPAVGRAASRGLRLVSAEWLAGSQLDDKIYLGPGQRGAEGGKGDDIIDAQLSAVFAGRSPRGFDVELYGGEGNDTLIAGRGRVSLSGGKGADRFVLATFASTPRVVELVIEDGEPEDRLLVAPHLLDGNTAFDAAADMEGGDLVITLARKPDRATAIIRIKSFTPGVLGIEPAPARLARDWLPEASHAGAHHLPAGLGAVE